MNDKKDSTSSTLQAIDSLVKNVSIYEDAIKPYAQVIGTGGHAILAALAPLQHKIAKRKMYYDFLTKEVAEELKGVPDERIQTPDVIIAGPILEDLKYRGHIDVLRKLYAHLLSKAMDSDKSANLHPSYIEILRQLSPKEAAFIEALKVSPCTIVEFQPDKENKNNIQGYISTNDNYEIISNSEFIIFQELTRANCANLDRLGIFKGIFWGEISFRKDGVSGWYNMERGFEEFSPFKELIAENLLQGKIPHIKVGYIHLNEFAAGFISACLSSGENSDDH